MSTMQMYTKNIEYLKKKKYKYSDCIFAVHCSQFYGTCRHEN